MANALIPNEITLWYKTKTAVDPESGEEEKAIIRQPSLGWNIGDGVLGIFVSESQLYMVPLSELEGILVEYTDEEEENGVQSPDGMDDEVLSRESSDSPSAGTGGSEAEADNKATIYVPNFGGGSKNSEES